MNENVSIVIRTCNRPQYLMRAIEHLAKNFPPKSEVIVVDDALPHEALSDEVLKEINQILPIEVLYLKTTGRIGRSAAANLGLENAKGKYFHLHDDDDTVELTFYEKMVSFLNDNPEFGAVCCHAYRIDESVNSNQELTELNRTIHNPHLKKFSFLSLATAFESPPICMLVRREVAIAAGGFNPEIDLGEDYDFTIRLLVEKDISVIQETLCSVYRRISVDKKSPEANSHSENESYQVECKIRNYHFRKDLKSGKLGLGWVFIFGEMNSIDRKVSLVSNKILKFSILKCCRIKYRV